jgi:acyl-coenzyme A synthetase/AMP-(fatty) acid ligase
MYRTGDLAYISEDGLIMFLGRRDNQIKHKGNRIELGEIETAAVCVPGVENACAVFDEDRQEIVLFVETQGTLPPRKFNLALKEYIPQYMLPAKLIPMERLPHTANDKIDRVALRQTLKNAEETRG